jgi:hypothetical protein
MHYVEAYAFRCPYSLSELDQELERIGSWRWISRDSDTYGEYLMGLTGDSARLRIFQDRDRYVLDIRYEAKSDDPDAEWSRYRQNLLDSVLPSLGATDIEQTDDYG